MRWRGQVKKKLLSLKKQGCKAFFALIDPDKDIELSAILAMKDFITALFIGGSLGVTPYEIDNLIKSLRLNGFDKPIVLFPGGLNNIAKEADAILFMSLLNSDDPYWIIGAQTAAAPIIAKLGLETIPTAYVIVGEGGTAGHVGKARPIPLNKPEVAAAYALAAKYLGMQFLYLEAGSGVKHPIPPEFVNKVRSVVGEDMYIIVGGGIRDVEMAKMILGSGADAIVVGTLIEQDPAKALEIAKTVSSTCTVRQDT